MKLFVGKRRRGTGGYLHTFNSRLFDKVTCLEMLQVSILNNPNFPRHGEPTYDSFSGTPSKDIAEIIHQNPGLKNLHLCLGASNHAGQGHKLLSTEIEHALENIGDSMHPLTSLTLEGTLHFTQSAWSSWDTNMKWADLRNLSVLTEALVQEVTENLVGRCCNLQSLTLEAPQSYRNISPSQPHRFQTDVTPFLSSLNLADLSLVGFNPDNLIALEGSGSNLQRLLFHIHEGPRFWATPGPHQIRSPPSFKDVLISPTRLATLQSTCPSLEWLAIDTVPFHLNNYLGGEGLWVPMAGYSSLDLQKSRQPLPLGRQNLPEDVPSSPRPARQFVGLNSPQLNSVQQDVADPIFETITRFRSLRHLRLFVHAPKMLWTFGLDDTIRTFLWLQKHKQGAPLESLVIYLGPGFWGRSHPYIVYEMGKGRVHVQHDRTRILYEQVGEPGRSGLLKELWRKDVRSKYTPLEQWERSDREGFVVPIAWI